VNIGGVGIGGDNPVRVQSMCNTDTRDVPATLAQINQLAEAGCEVCHGPGYDHVESGGDTDLIKRDLSLDDCAVCHNPERVSAFDFKPLLFGGAH